MNRSLAIHTEHGPLYGQLDLIERPGGLVLLARARHVPLDAVLAERLNEAGFSSLRMELLTSQEAQFVDATHNVPRLAQRLTDLLELVQRDGDMAGLSLAILANGDTTPAALRAAARRDRQVLALACHGGLIDRAGREALNCLKAPLLVLFDAGDDDARTAFQRALPYLGQAPAECTLAMGDDPVDALAPWLRNCLPDPTAGEILDFSA